MIVDAATYIADEANTLEEFKENFIEIIAGTVCEIDPTNAICSPCVADPESDLCYAARRQCLVDYQDNWIDNCGPSVFESDFKASLDTCVSDAGFTQQTADYMKYLAEEYRMTAMGAN